MLLDNNRLAARWGLDHRMDEARDRALEVLCHRYVRELQHVMRLRQHAERFADGAIGPALLRIAAREAAHLRTIAENIANLGGKLPAVIDFHCSHDNAWEYLRSDLDEERRCIAEIEEDKLRIAGEFPVIAGLLERIETDAKKHREEIRALLSDERRPLWAA